MFSTNYSFNTKVSSMQNRNIALPALTLSLLSSIAFAAPTAPDAGTISRELQNQPVLDTPKTVVPLRSEKAAPAPSTAGDVKIAIKAVLVTGNTLFTAAELEALVADLAGGEHSLAELNKGAARITAYYRARGYVVARAYLPAQDIKDGIVTINVMEGLVGQVSIKNQSRISDKVSSAHMSKVKPGAALQGSQVDRAILLLSDAPGVGGARATLQPGASVGTSDLLIELNPGKAYAANIEADNYGNRYIGENRLGAALALNSPFNVGDQLTVRALGSDGGMTYARLAYQLPLGGDGWKLGAAYSDTTYKLIQEFASLQAHGTATSNSVYVSYPMVRSQATNLSGTLTYEGKELADFTDVPVSSTNKKVQLVNLGFAGNHQDALLGGGVTSLDISMVSGYLDMDANSLATDATTAKTKGVFTKLDYTFNRLQRLSDKNTLSFAINGQQADNNLASSEKFSLGGATGVRAYPQGEGSGDQGWISTLELRHAFFGGLQGVVFYDAGGVVINRKPYTTAPNTRDISGAGLGVNMQYKAVQLKTCVSWQTGAGGQAQSEPVSVNKNPRGWVQLSAGF
jgi:hemolysin activation/secretion protein